MPGVLLPTVVIFTGQCRNYFLLEVVDGVDKQVRPCVCKLVRNQANNIVSA